MIKFIRLHPNDMTEGDKLALIKFSKWDTAQRRAPSELISFVLNGWYQLWRAIGDPEEVECLLLTRVIRTDKGGRTLYVEGLVGRGFSRYPKACFDALEGLAKQGECQSITGWVHRPGMIKMVKAGGLPIVAQVFAKQIGG